MRAISVSLCVVKLRRASRTEIIRFPKARGARSSLAGRGQPGIHTRTTIGARTKPSLLSKTSRTNLGK